MYDNLLRYPTFCYLHNPLFHFCMIEKCGFLGDYFDFGIEVVERYFVANDRRLSRLPLHWIEIPFRALVLVLDFCVVEMYAGFPPSSHSHKRHKPAPHSRSPYQTLPKENTC